MRILVTNDDGVLSPGIIALATHLKSAGHEVIVVAPERQHSSVGHAITLHRPLRLWQIGNGPYPEGVAVYACNGTPSDSVVLGLEELDPSVEIVCSGINIGPNLGDDLTYSEQYRLQWRVLCWGVLRSLFRWIAMMKRVPISIRRASSRLR